MARYRRTGWITQLAVEERDGTIREFDRFVCRWYGEGPSDFHTRYGPAGVPFPDALRWCCEHAQRTFVDGFGQSRWSIGEPSDGFPPLPDPPVEAPLSWTEHAGARWKFEISLTLGFRDYADAAPGFELALRSGGHEVRRVVRDDFERRLGATLVITAPNAYLATCIVGDEARRAASDPPDGLLDEQGDCLWVEIVREKLEPPL